MLRVLAAGAAVTAVAGAVVMRRWDTAAGKRVADLTRARASDEWRHDERVAELETDLDESRELRVKLEHKLRAKRTELAGLRNEHAALLRRYATAETERATALEGRRQLAIEASVPTRALPAARTAPDETAVPEPVDPAGFFGVAEAPDAEDERERSAEAGRPRRPTAPARRRARGTTRRTRRTRRTPRRRRTPRTAARRPGTTRRPRTPVRRAPQSTPTPTPAPAPMPERPPTPTRRVRSSRRPVRGCSCGRAPR